MHNTLITKPLTKILAQFGFPSNKPDFRSIKVSKRTHTLLYLIDNLGKHRHPRPNKLDFSRYIFSNIFNSFHNSNHNSNIGNEKKLIHCDKLQTKKLLSS